MPPVDCVFGVVGWFLLILWHQAAARDRESRDSKQANDYKFDLSHEIPLWFD